ncbi:hypothetical protein NQZ68_025444 [Dissostichus eleginoides]|nr:hypothetical protein NQZ68_025444 [Dissostichus eleginoides]
MGSAGRRSRSIRTKPPDSWDQLAGAGRRSRSIRTKPPDSWDQLAGGPAASGLNLQTHGISWQEVQQHQD